MADDARALAMKRLQLLVLKWRAAPDTEEGRTCAGLVLSIIDNHGFKVTDPIIKTRVSTHWIADLVEQNARARPPDSRPDTSYPTGVSCVYCKKFIMFREQYTEVEGGVVHDRCFEGYETQRKHYK